MEELWRPLKRLNLCCVTVAGEILCISASLVSVGLRVSQGCTADWDWRAELCSSWVQPAGPAAPVSPQALWLSKCCCRVQQGGVWLHYSRRWRTAEPSRHGVGFYGFCHVDVMGLPPTLPCPVANLLCQITGDNSDAIGGQLCFLTSGSGVQQ